MTENLVNIMCLSSNLSQMMSSLLLMLHFICVHVYRSTKEATTEIEIKLDLKAASLQQKAGAINPPKTTSS